ncbi:hypothetical protein [Streptomyces sp. NL15-2K]|uniref:hypothetical protein n=1 Tax=Streptomyces sp. NL15-2K TaxID=376149 RepID=UPI000FF91B48|nr:hypothetical protein SNL152K_8909 [Streptomyces sp. NL15-2K]
MNHPQPTKSATVAEVEQGNTGRPDSAAALLITAGDNPEQLSGEVSFAALCGAGARARVTAGLARPKAIR